MSMAHLMTILRLSLGAESHFVGFFTGSVFISPEALKTNVVAAVWEVQTGQKDCRLNLGTSHSLCLCSGRLHQSIVMVARGAPDTCPPCCCIVSRAELQSRSVQQSV